MIHIVLNQYNKYIHTDTMIFPFKYLVSIYIKVRLNVMNFCALCSVLLECNVSINNVYSAAKNNKSYFTTEPDAAFLVLLVILGYRM